MLRIACAAERGAVSQHALLRWPAQMSTRMQSAPAKSSLPIARISLREHGAASAQIKQNEPWEPHAIAATSVVILGEQQVGLDYSSMRQVLTHAVCVILH